MSTTRRIRRPNQLSAIAAENAALRTQNAVLYNLLETCRDWLKIMGADLSKVSKVESALRVKSIVTTVP